LGGFVAAEEVGDAGEDGAALGGAPCPEDCACGECATSQDA
jgi:hypothetical protein